MSELKRLAQSTRAWACYDCGKCTSSCPLTRAGAAYSPRRHVLSTNLGERAEAVSADVFRCLSCMQCDVRCPAEVSYTDLVLELRALARTDQLEPECPHGGALQSVMRMMATGGTTQDRLSWLDDGLATEPDSAEVFLWTGCTMYYDAFFSDFEMNTLAGTKAAIRLLNALGITPVVSRDERCCGHDLLWNGDRASFAALARHNVELVAASGAGTLVVPCAECLRTWRIDYEPFMAGRRLQILHLSEFLAEHVDELPLAPAESRRATYQDPCRLGRHLGVFDAPRSVMSAVPGLELREMGRSRGRAVCCAGGTFSSCDRYAKQIQAERLREARGTGAALMVTSCPKCQVHFKCAMRDPLHKDDLEINMCDLAELVAGSLTGTPVGDGKPKTAGSGTGTGKGSGQ